MSTQERKRPNLLFILADQWRGQSIGCLQQDPVITPAVDRLVEEGFTFTQALSACPICVPARGSILTGRYPNSNRIIHNGCRFPDDQTCIAEVLKTTGYRTGYIGKWHLDGRHHETQFVPPERRKGFDFWYANNMVHHLFLCDYYTGEDEHRIAYGWQPDHETDIAIEYMKKHKNERFALFLSWAPPHPGREHTRESILQKAKELEQENIEIHATRDLGDVIKRAGYIAPRAYEEKYSELVSLDRPNFSHKVERGGRTVTSSSFLPGYFGAITSLDDNIARLVSFLEKENLRDNTILVLHSDHGEMLGSHARLQKHIWYEEALNVPFIVSWPERIEPGRDNALFNQVDIMPTILGLMDVPIPDCVEGLDFSATVLGKKRVESEETFVYFHNEHDNPNHLDWRCVRTQEYSYVVTRDPKDRIQKLVYNLNEDPYQLDPMDAEENNDPAVENLDKALIQWLEERQDPFTKHLARDGK